MRKMKRKMQSKNEFKKRGKELNKKRQYLIPSLEMGTRDMILFFWSEDN